MVNIDLTDDSIDEGVDTTDNLVTDPNAVTQGVATNDSRTDSNTVILELTMS